MKKNAFTLIELLAVIVILAIIALIAVPIVIHIINDSKKSSEEQSLELYRDSVQKAIVNYQMTHPSFNPSECKIQSNGDIKCETIYIKVQMKGTKPTRGTVIIENNKVTLENVLLNGIKYYKKSFATLLSDADNNGEVSIGDKYTYKVNDMDTFNFYVLSITNDKVNLIMDRNICSSEDENINGTVSSITNLCLIAWYSGVNNNSNGPVTAMQGIYNATKDWTNVPDMIMSYEDENNKNSLEYGYKSIVTNNGVTKIIAKNETVSTTMGTSIKPLKARLPMYEEILNSGCHIYSSDLDFGTCPTWLMEYLREPDSYAPAAIEAYASLIKQQHTFGYWLLSSKLEDSGANMVYHDGRIADVSTNASNNYGIRPVITVSIDELS